MKKFLVLIMTVLLAVSLFAGCAGEQAEEPAPEPEPEKTEEPAPDPEPEPEPEPEESASFVIDFEADDVYTYQTVNFDEAFTEECYAIEPVDGFDGNALSLTVKNQAEGNTWWVAGTAFAPTYSQEASFKDLEKVTFKYTSSVDYSDEIQFVVQLVWKDVITAEEVTSFQVDFPITKTTEFTRFEIEVPEEVRDDLNSVTGYYLDWCMIGLEGNAEDLFNPGSFAIDDIAFFGDASYIPPVVEIPSGPAALFTIDFETEGAVVWQTVNFDDAFTADCLEVGPVDGFSGNAYKYKVTNQEEGNTWWAAGLAFDPAYTAEVDFTGLKRVTLDYVSSVDYSGEVQFHVQLVWKNEAAEEIAAYTVDFPIVETSEVATFEIEIPEDVMAILDAAEGIHFDWFMTGLTDNADDLFNPGSFTIDNISFYNE